MLFLRNTLIATKFFDKRGKTGENEDFTSKILCVTVTKKLVGGHFSSSKVSGFEKTYASEGYVTFFCSGSFYLRLPQNFLGEPFCAVFQKFIGIEKVYG